MRKFGASDLYDAGRLAAAVGTNALLPHLGLDFKGSLGDAVGPTAQALVASGLIILLTNIIFGRPAIRVEWIIDREFQSGPRLPFQMVDPSTPLPVQINCRLVKGGLLAEGFWWATRGSGLTLSVKCSPSDSLKFSRGQYYSRHSILSEIVNERHLRFDVLTVGPNADCWIEVDLLPNAVPSASLMVSCDYNVEVGANFKRLWQRWYTVRSQITHIELTRALNGGSN